MQFFHHQGEISFCASVAESLKWNHLAGVKIVKTIMGDQLIPILETDKVEGIAGLYMVETGANSLI